MEWIEITAKSVDAAKERALDELGIDDDDAEFDVVEEPRRGLFGQLRGSARVRARVKPRAPREKTERRGRRGRKPRGDADSSERSERGSTNDKDQHDENAKSKDTAADATEEPPKSQRRPNKSGGRSKGSGSGRSRTKSENTSEQQGTKMAMTLDEQVVASETFLAGLVEAMDVNGLITTERTDEDNAYVNIEGADLGLLIGPSGQTMNSIQDLTRITLQKQAAGSWEGHVHVDVNGYRAKRRDALIAFVTKIAADVLDSGTAKALEPMSSSDRKIVHDAVNEIDGVTTSSEGRDPRRWVQISPDDA